MWNQGRPGHEQGPPPTAAQVHKCSAEIGLGEDEEDRDDGEPEGGERRPELVEAA